MENNDNKRKKKVISGTASLNRRDDKPVETNGPVGRKDGYQGRKTQFGAKKPAGSGSEQSGSLLSSRSRARTRAARGSRRRTRSRPLRRGISAAIRAARAARPVQEEAF